MAFLCVFSLLSVSQALWELKSHCSGLGPLFRSVRSCDQSLLERADSSMPTHVTGHHNITTLLCHKKDTQKTVLNVESLIRLYWWDPEIFVERRRKKKKVFVPHTKRLQVLHIINTEVHVQCTNSEGKNECLEVFHGSEDSKQLSVMWQLVCLMILTNFLWRNKTETNKAIAYRVYINEIKWTLNYMFWNDTKLENMIVDYSTFNISINPPLENICHLFKNIANKDVCKYKKMY